MDMNLVLDEISNKCSCVWVHVFLLVKYIAVITVLVSSSCLSQIGSIVLSVYTVHLLFKYCTDISCVPGTFFLLGGAVYPISCEYGG